MIIRTKYREPWWKTVAPQPAVQVAFSNLFPMSVPATVDMVDNQHVSICFATLGADAAVGIEDLIRKLSPQATVFGSTLFGVVPGALALSRQLRTVFTFSTIRSSKFAAAGHTAQTGRDSGFFGSTGVWHA